MKMRCNYMRAKPAALILITTGVAANIFGQATGSSSPNYLIPDNNLNGVTDTINLTAPFTSISDMEVTLDISGPYVYNGDYYAYLTHGTGFAVLLNRVGSTVSNPYGSTDNGFSVTFSDSASADIHTENAAGGLVTGTWLPDGRNVSPLLVLGTDPQTALLSSFDGVDPNGAWNLFVADVSPGGYGYLTSWSLDVTGTTAAVPEYGGPLESLLSLAVPLTLWSLWSRIPKRLQSRLRT